MPKSMRYGTLNTFNPQYDGAWINKLQLLYAGEPQIGNNAGLFLFQEESRGENTASYEARKKCVAYDNYFAKIVNGYNSNLFEKPFSVLPASDASDGTTLGNDVQAGEPNEFYKEFSRNADLKYHNLSYVLSNISQRAMVTQRAYIGVDFQKPQEVNSLLEEEQSNNHRAYLCDIDTLSVIDWEYDDYDNFKWVVIKSEDCPRDSFMSQRSVKRIDFKVWEKVDDQVSYYVFRWQGPANTNPNQDDECILIEEGTVSFPEIPVLCYHLPQHLWIGGLIGNLAIEHFRRNSELVWSKKRNLFSQAYILMGPEYKGNSSGQAAELNTTQSDESRDQIAKRELRRKGVVVLGQDDKLGFWEPDGKVYEIEQESLKDLINTMHALVGLGENTIGQQRITQESGLKAMVDNREKELVLISHANLIKDFSTKLYRFISEGRKENIMWRVVGMEEFQFTDPDKYFDRVQQIGGIPSKTWKKHTLLNLATKTAENISAETLDVVKAEIDEAVDKMDEADLVEPTTNQIMQAKSNDSQDKDNK